MKYLILIMCLCTVFSIITTLNITVIDTYFENFLIENFLLAGFQPSKHADAISIDLFIYYFSIICLKAKYSLYIIFKRPLY
jgi:hypothetical protein